MEPIFHGVWHQFESVCFILVSFVINKDDKSGPLPALTPPNKVYRPALGLVIERRGTLVLH
ncbi:MAG: hypothetical protein CMI09_04910 [Oceanospirillaceae bacterium]|nr:hypothetical protein [Oceanospirillaceae bacterium]|tara:strand:+ start:172 stop:354 length:183 start_codon:yes stop_codon:yes gene_type:complete